MIKKSLTVQLHEDVCKFANVLKTQGVQQRRPCLYLFTDDRRSSNRDAGLCAHWCSAFDCFWRFFCRIVKRPHYWMPDCKYVVCADEGYRGGKTIPIKANTVDKAAANCCSMLKKVIVIQEQRRSHQIGMNIVTSGITMRMDRPLLLIVHPEPMDAEDPLVYPLYTSGSTGKPKGVHCTATGGYLLFTLP
jgi:acetyl-CoA synthetase